MTGAILGTGWRRSSGRPEGCNSVTLVAQEVDPRHGARTAQAQACATGPALHRLKPVPLGYIPWHRPLACVQALEYGHCPGDCTSPAWTGFCSIYRRIRASSQ